MTELPIAIASAGEHRAVDGQPCSCVPFSEPESSRRQPSRSGMSLRGSATPPIFEGDVVRRVGADAQDVALVHHLTPHCLCRCRSTTTVT